MKKLIITVAALGLAVVPAAAEEAVFNWSGAYVGGQVGYGWSDSNAWHVYHGSKFLTSPLHPEGGLAGVYAGYNHQMASGVVLGGEVDIAASDIAGSARFSHSSGIPFPGNTATSKLKWTGAVRGRAGYAFDRFLPYVAGGLVLGRYDVVPDYAAIPPHSLEKTYVGWTIGAGVEYAITDHLTTRIDYRFSDFGGTIYDFVSPSEQTEVELRTHDLRFGIAYKF